MSGYQSFLNEFNSLHHEMRRVLDAGNGATFDECLRHAKEKRKFGRDDCAFLDDCRGIRNFLAHSNDMLSKGGVGITIENKVVERLQNLKGKLSGGIPATKIAIPRAKVLTAGMDQPLKPLMHQMAQNQFSHVPVVEAGAVQGVFDERVLFRALAEDRLDAVTSQSRVRDVVASFLFSVVDPADFGVIFASRRTSLADLRNQFDRRKNENDRISLVLITENGRAAESLLGLVTIWDIPFAD